MAQSVDNARKSNGRHFSQRFIPAVSYAGHALEIAAIGRLNIDFRQVRHSPAKMQAIGAGIDADSAAGAETVLFRYLGRQNEPSRFVKVSFKLFHHL